jgi:hypothetical protein
MLWQWQFHRVILQSPRKWGILYWIPFVANRVLYSDIQSPTPDKQSQLKRRAPGSKEIQRCRMHLLGDFPIWKCNHTNAIVIIEAKKLASDELTVLRVLARDESIIDMSFQSIAIRNHHCTDWKLNRTFPNRLIMRPSVLKSRDDFRIDGIPPTLRGSIVESEGSSHNSDQKLPNKM